MKHGNVYGLALGMAAAAMVTTGCGSQRLMQSSARTAADQLVALQAEVQQKIETENDYVRKELDAMVDGLQKARRDDFEVLLTKMAEEFAEGGGDPVTFLTDFVTAWEQKETDRLAKIESVTTQLEGSRVELETSAARIADLLSKLRALGEAPSKGQLAKFVFGFVDATYQELEAQQASE